jgi:ketosteroid isomerase-like protein
MKPVRREWTLDEAEIFDRVESVAQSIREKDVAAVMTHYTADVVAYDVMAALETRGADEYRKNFERWFASMLGPIEYESSGLRISMSESHAFCHCVSHVRGVRSSGDKADYRVRVTACFQKMNGQWLIAHEHVSMPVSI